MDFLRKKHLFSPDIKARLLPLRQLDNWHGLVAVAYDYLVIAVSVYLFFLQPWFYPISVILIGSRQRALATLLHESAHRCLLKSKVLNRFVGTFLSGYLIFQEYNIYVDTHVKKHHGFLGDQNHDPDLIYHQEQGLYQPMSKRSFFYRFIITPLLLLKCFSYLTYLIKNRLCPTKKYTRSFVKMISFWGLIAATCWYFDAFGFLIILWFIPLITTSAVFGWFNELAEHYPMDPKNNIDIHMSRNRFSHWLEHFLCNTHNENYHLIHHLYPTIPFWNLPKAHLILSEDIDYAQINKNAGGIFVSKNKNPSLVKWLLHHNQANDIKHIYSD